MECARGAAELLQRADRRFAGRTETRVGIDLLVGVPDAELSRRDKPDLAGRGGRRAVVTWEYQGRLRSLPEVGNVAPRRESLGARQVLLAESQRILRRRADSLPDSEAGRVPLST